MRKTSVLLLFHILVIYNTWAQPLRDTGRPPMARPAKFYPVDKNIVLEYFQNQQFDDALCLTPCSSPASKGIVVAYDG